MWTRRSGSPERLLAIEYRQLCQSLWALDAPKQASLEADILALLERLNRGPRDTLIVPGEYLEAVVTKR
jgi:hypothetical protein